MLLAYTIGVVMFVVCGAVFRFIVAEIGSLEGKGL